MGEEPPSQDPTSTQHPTLAPARSGPEPGLESIGPYVLLEKRGEGGMGIVYLAEQREPVRRRVAVKIIKHGHESDHVVARFEAERQALALMDHPAIAKIYDAGTTPQGRPYFVMEYVRGVPVTEYCDHETLSNRERIELFLQICEGVQHAHQKAVIHRDLKPSNVLISVQGDRPAVKIIDFGLAKALAEPLTERTLHTEFGALLGTPEYMSPEQAAMNRQDVDTRSDVYSLGVMLYKLLTGVLPFESKELREAGFDEIRRKICEQDPLRPSTRASLPGDRLDEAARRRRTDSHQLRRELKGDLDWITMRALEKDPGRRYASPADLAEDLRRYLRCEPVLARAPSARYRAWKFIRRHRLGVAAAGVMGLGLAAGTIGSTVGLVRARRAETAARTEAAVKGEVADFLKNLFTVSDPARARGSSVTARELLDKAAATLDTRLSGDPETRAEMAAIMGEVYKNLGLFDSAEKLTRKALVLRRQRLGAEDPQTLELMALLGSIYDLQSRYRDEERIYAQVFEVQKRVLGPEHPDTVVSMMRLAGTNARLGRYADAERLYVQSLELQKQILGDEDWRTRTTTYNLGLLYMSQKRLPEAEALLVPSLETARRLDGENDPTTLLTMGSLGEVYQAEGRLAEAERLYRQAIEIGTRVWGPEHDHLLLLRTRLGLLYQDLGRFADAEKIDLQNLEVQRRVLGPEHTNVLWSMNNLAFVYQSEGRLKEAERLHKQTLEIRSRVLGPTHPDTLVSMYNLACVCARQGRRAEAMEWLRKDVEGGEIDVDSMAKDPELVSLHGPEFDALLAQVRRNADAAKAQPAVPPAAER
jgi:serine/threonine protein kinase/Flp pilus assembly protein TadD